MTDERCAIEDSLQWADIALILHSWHLTNDRGDWYCLGVFLIRAATKCTAVAGIMAHLVGTAEQHNKLNFLKLMAYEFYFLSDIAAERAKEPE